MATTTDHKRCFVIAPIGEEGSEVRRHSDTVYDGLIRPAVISHGYTPQRAHEQHGSQITPEIISSIFEYELVVIDLTGLNPNVCYELALAHGRKMPFIQISDSRTKIPFDVRDIRTIFYDLSVRDTLDSHASFNRARDEITTRIRELENDPEKTSSPVRKYFWDRELRDRGDLLSHNMNELSSKFAEVHEVVGKVAGRPDLRAKFLKEINENGGPRALMIASLAAIYEEVAPWIQSLGTFAYRETILSSDSNMLPVVRKFLQEVEEFNEHPIVVSYKEEDRISAENVALIDAVVRKIRETDDASH